jgi:uncharacterized RDD family membrane protein YckC
MVDRYLARGVDARARQIVTPEGVPLQFTLASGGDRAAAFVLDFLFLVVGVVVLAVVFSLAGGGPWMEAFLMVGAFVLRNFYFVIFETRWQGLTPGKRIIGIRVVDARGGQLEAGAILARNLVREIEIWQPMALIFASGVIWPDAPGWAKLVATLWVFVFAMMPLFNKDRLRMGDLVGGTRVVVQPRTLLLPDLADGAAAAPVMPGWAPPAPGAMFSFTGQQLDVYGIFELQVLEGVLRGEAGTVAHHEAITTVAAKIHAKIDYRLPVPVHAHERFLRDFYTALRAHLEKRMLFGHRKEDKHSPR